MFRLLILLLAFVPFGRRRRPFYYRRDYYDRPYYDYSEQYGDLAERLRLFIRRRRALNSSKKYFTRQRGLLVLRNKNIIFAFDTRKQIMTLVDKYDEEHTMTVVWAEQDELHGIAMDNILELTFDEICFSFTNNATFAGIESILNERFPRNHKTPKRVTNNILKDKQKEIPICKKVNVNIANAEELAELEGITLIVAKKIIKYRDLNGGFKTKEEFFKKMKIKPHFVKRLEDVIDVSIVETTSNKKSVDRIIDF